MKRRATRKMKSQTRRTRPIYRGGWPSCTGGICGSTGMVEQPRAVGPALTAALKRQKEGEARRATPVATRIANYKATQNAKVEKYMSNLKNRTRNIKFNKMLGNMRIRTLQNRLADVRKR